eukprot:jgi/Mesvir1/7070/Mv09182-RA.1
MLAILANYLHAEKLSYTLEMMELELKAKKGVSVELLRQGCSTTYQEHLALALASLQASAPPTADAAGKSGHPLPTDAASRAGGGTAPVAGNMAPSHAQSAMLSAGTYPLVHLKALLKDGIAAMLRGCDAGQPCFDVGQWTWRPAGGDTCPSDAQRNLAVERAMLLVGLNALTSSNGPPSQANEEGGDGANSPPPAVDGGQVSDADRAAAKRAVADALSKAVVADASISRITAVISKLVRTMVGPADITKVRSGCFTCVENHDGAVVAHPLARAVPPSSLPSLALEPGRHCPGVDPGPLLVPPSVPVAVVPASAGAGAMPAGAGALAGPGVSEPSGSTARREDAAHEIVTRVTSVLQPGLPTANRAVELMVGGAGPVPTESPPAARHIPRGESPPPAKRQRGRPIGDQVPEPTRLAESVHGRGDAPLPVAGQADNRQGDAGEGAVGPVWTPGGNPVAASPMRASEGHSRDDSRASMVAMPDQRGGQKQSGQQTGDASLDGSGPVRNPVVGSDPMSGQRGLVQARDGPHGASVQDGGMSSRAESGDDATQVDAVGARLSSQVPGEGAHSSHASEAPCQETQAMDVASDDVATQGLEPTEEIETQAMEVGEEVEQEETQRLEAAVVETTPQDVRNTLGERVAPAVVGDQGLGTGELGLETQRLEELAAGSLREVNTQALDAGRDAETQSLEAFPSEVVGAVETGRLDSNMETQRLDADTETQWFDAPGLESLISDAPRLDSAQQSETQPMEAWGAADVRGGWQRG